jgi:uncharacterized protein YkwD
MLLKKAIKPDNTIKTELTGSDNQKQNKNKKNVEPQKSNSDFNINDANSRSRFPIIFCYSGQSSTTTILDTEIDAAALTTLTNQVREIKSLAPLISNDKLLAAAEAKADDLIAKGYFSHTSPSGKEFFTWIEETDYQYQIIGENLAVGFSNNKEVIKAWLDSPAHRDNILNEKYREIGIVVKQGIFDDQEQTLVVQIFGSPYKLRLSELFSGFNQILGTAEKNLNC